MDRRRYLAAFPTIAGFGLAGCGAVVGEAPMTISNSTQDEQLTISGDGSNPNWPQVGQDSKNTAFASGAPSIDAPVSVTGRMTAPVTFGLVADSNRVYAATADGGVVLTENLTEAWRPSKADSGDSGVGAMTVAGDLVVAPVEKITGDIVLVTLDAKSGKELSINDTLFGEVDRFGGLTYYSNTLFATAENTVVSCSTGLEPHWEQTLNESLSESADVLGRPAVEGGQLFTVAPEAQRVFALDSASGDRRWTKTLDLPSHCSLDTHPVCGGKYVFIQTACAASRSLDGESTAPPPSTDLYALRRTDGAVVRSWSLPGLARGPPALADGALFATAMDVDAGKVHVLTADVDEWSQRWTYTARSDTVSAPAVTPEAVYVGLGDAVVALSTSDGSKRWSVPLDGNPGPPIVSGDTLYCVLLGEDPTEIVALQ